MVKLVPLLGNILTRLGLKIQLLLVEKHRLRPSSSVVELSIHNPKLKGLNMTPGEREIGEKVLSNLSMSPSLK